MQWLANTALLDCRPAGESKLLDSYLSHDTDPSRGPIPNIQMMTKPKRHQPLVSAVCSASAASGPGYLKQK